VLRRAAGFALALLAVAAIAHAERSISVAGYFGVYDPATVAAWPERLQMIVGGVDRQGALVGAAKNRAAVAANPARFVFYLSFSTLDGGCNCFEADVLARFRREHAECLLRDPAGEPVSNFLQQLPRGRQLVLDLGNSGCVDAWLDAALGVASRHGWDGVWADNVNRGTFDETWSAVPVNPRTHRPYTVGEYRADMLEALHRARRRFDAAGKLFIGNHGAGWQSFEDDPVIRKQILAMHGVEIEDFAYTFGGAPHPEGDWLKQLRYMDFANRNGVLTWAHGGKDTFMDPAKREYVLASYLLTRRGRSVVGDLNAVATWWPALATDVGAPAGDFYCLDPATPCPAPGRVFGRDFAHARVLVNPGDAPRSVPLGGTFRTLDGAPAPDPLPLGPHSGRVLVRDDHTASRTSSGRAGR